MKVIVTFSGGKDSLASLIWARENLTKKITAVFCDTGWESETTYSYIEHIKKKLGMELIVLSSTKYNGMLGVAEKKKRFPSPKARFCTQELKVKPMIDFILDKVNDDILIIQGIRGSESRARSLMEKQCTYFKYYRQPYRYNKKGKAIYHTYRKKDVLEHLAKYSDDILRPVFNWTSQEVISYITEHGIELNPLYKQGFKRVGCFPCVNCSLLDIKQLMRYYPDRISYISKKEKKLGMSFFPPGKIPAHQCKNGHYPFIDEITTYLKRKSASLSLFPEQENTSCMSLYGLCE